MKIVSSYQVRLMDNRNLFDDTVQLYRKAVAFLIEAANKEWETLGPVYKEGTFLAQQALERLVHTTKNHPSPKYDFDKEFYKFPSYFRRAAISAALGAVSSYHNSLRNWQDSGKQGKQPTLAFERDIMPTFFKKMMSESEKMLLGEEDIVYLKLYEKHDWVFVPIRCRHQDVKYLAKWWSTVKASSPTLEVRRRKGRSSVYCLRYAFEEKRDLTLRDEPLERRTILAVDLGINNDAVCSVMCADGTVMARKFINFPSEKDRLHHILNRIKRLQREHGRTGGRHEWAKATRINEQLSRDIADAIINVATEYAVHVIVFEHLSMNGRIRGGKRQLLHLWRKNTIQEIVEHKAHRNLMRISRVCAWGTSKLAFDGSGAIFRGRVNLAKAELAKLIQKRDAGKSLGKDGRPETYCGQERCTFTNGKEYNCDLSASYNIGARYFLREMCKENPKLLEQLPKTTLRTYADLRKLRLQPAA